MNTATIDVTDAPAVHAETMDVRMTRIETIIPMLATKTDLESLRWDFERGQKKTVPGCSEPYSPCLSALSAQEVTL